MDEDNVIDRILELVLEIIDNGEELDDELIQAVSSILMDRLQSQPTPKPDIPQAQFPSSNVFGFNYNKDSGKLLIKYMGKETAQSGPTYEYTGIPNYIFEVLKRGAVAPRTTGKNKYHAWFKGKTPSHGASVYALIKEAGFPYRKVA